MKGTEKQIAWAEKIAANFYKRNHMDYVETAEDEQEAKNMSILLDRFMETHQDAAWWIKLEKGPSCRRSDGCDMRNVVFCDWMDEIAEDETEMAVLIGKGLVMFEEEA